MEPPPECECECELAITNMISLRKAFMRMRAMKVLDLVKRVSYRLGRAAGGGRPRRAVSSTAVHTAAERVAYP